MTSDISDSPQADSAQMTEVLTFPDKQFHMILQGHVLDCLAKLPDDSIDTVVTSPPYWGLRDYKLPPTVWDADPKCEHEWGDEQTFRKRGYFNPETTGLTNHGEAQKDSLPDVLHQGNYCQKCSAWKGQLGLEPDFRLYVRHLLQITKELKRVLKPTGCLWLNLGDTYSGSGQGGQTGYGDSKRQKVADALEASITIKTGLPAKSLCFIPQRIALDMIDEQGWILRNQVVWFKPNGMPSSVRDRFSNRWEPMFFFVKEPRYWFDLDAVREPHVSYDGRKKTTYDKSPKAVPIGDHERWPEGGKNPGDVFKITTEPHPFAHFAVYPDALVERPVKASCPLEVCVKCGKARERITERKDQGWDGSVYGERAVLATGGAKKGGTRASTLGSSHGQFVGKYETLGWTSCSCSPPQYRPGIVLDPFAGSGTTAVVAKRLQRSSISIELAEHYIPIIKQRLDFGHETIDGAIVWAEPEESREL